MSGVIVLVVFRFEVRDVRYEWHRVQIIHDQLFLDVCGVVAGVVSTVSRRFVIVDVVDVIATHAQVIGNVLVCVNVITHGRLAALNGIWTVAIAG